MFKKCLYISIEYWNLLLGLHIKPLKAFLCWCLIWSFNCVVVYLNCHLMSPIVYLYTWFLFFPLRNRQIIGAFPRFVSFGDSTILSTRGLTACIISGRITSDSEGFLIVSSVSLLRFILLSILQVTSSWTRFGSELRRLMELGCDKTIVFGLTICPNLCF
jgi:hypothetical protein